MKVYEVIKRTGEKTVDIFIVTGTSTRDIKKRIEGDIISITEKKFSIDKEKFVDCLSTSFSKDDIEVITAINENYFNWKGR